MSRARRKAWRTRDVGEGRFFDVDADPDVGDAGLFGDAEAGGLAEGGGGLGGQEGEVELAGAEAELGGFGVLDVADLDLFEAGAGAGVGVVADEGGAALAFEAADLEGAGADGAGVVGGAALEDGLAADDAAADVADADGHERGAGALHDDAAGVFAGDFDGLEVGPIAFVGAFLAADGGDGEAFEGEFDVFGGHFAVVVGEGFGRV